MPLIVCSTAPPRPSQKVCWWSFSLTRSGSSAAFADDPAIREAYLGVI